MLNLLGKIFEKIIHKRLLWYAEKDNWLSERQHGFMEGRSTETAILKLTNLIERNKGKKTVTAALFLDISAAFDSAWPPAIVEALLKKKCPSYLAQLITSFLTGRKGSINEGSLSFEKNTHIGCPQGSILSPFL